MTEAQAIEAIIQHWHTAWTAARPDVPYKLDNEVGEADALWCRITVRPSASNQVGLGAIRRWARRGRIAVQLFAPINAGDAALAELVDDVRTVLEGVSITTAGVDEPVKTYALDSGERLTDGAWHMAMVSVAFRYDQHR